MSIVPIEHDPALAEILRRLVDAYQPERRDSDLACKALRGTGLAADVSVWTRDQFDRRAHVVASLPAIELRS